MSILMNKKAKMQLDSVNEKPTIRIDGPNHLSFHAGVLTPRVYNPGKNNITADEVRNKLFAETAMAVVKEKMQKENIPSEMLPDDMIKQIIVDNIVENEIDKQVSELPPEVQTPMAEAFRTANKNRDRSRNRGRGHRE